MTLVLTTLVNLLTLLGLLIRPNPRMREGLELMMGDRVRHPGFIQTLSVHLSEV